MFKFIVRIFTSATVEDHIAPLANIIKNLEAHVVAKAREELQHVEDITHLTALQAAAHSEVERAKAIAAKISTLFA